MSDKGLLSENVIVEFVGDDQKPEAVFYGTFNRKTGSCFPARKLIRWLGELTRADVETLATEGVPEDQIGICQFEEFEEFEGSATTKGAAKVYSCTEKAAKSIEALGLFEF